MEKQRNEFCKTKNQQILKPTFTYKHESINIPYVKVFGLSKEFNKSYLDKKYPTFKDSWITIDYQYSNYTKHDLDHLYDHTCTEIDLNWFEQQSNYIKSLSRDELLTLSSYSNYGYEIINNWCIDNNEWWSQLYKILHYNSSSYFPFFIQFLNVIEHFHFTSKQKNIIDKLKNSRSLSSLYTTFISIKNQMNDDSWKIFWKEVLIEYSRDLERIILNSPKTNSCMTVWRGSTTPYWTNSFLNKEEYLFKNFTSTSLELSNTDEFRDLDCCLMRIIIPKNSRCLCLGTFSVYSNEAEILFSKDSIFKIDQEIMKEKDLIEIPYKKVSSIPEEELCKEFKKIETTFLIFDRYL